MTVVDHGHRGSSGIEIEIVLGALGLLVTATVGETGVAVPDHLVVTAEIAAPHDPAAVQLKAEETGVSVVVAINAAAALPDGETDVMTVVSAVAMKTAARKAAQMIAAAIVALVMAAAESEVAGATIAVIAEETGVMMTEVVAVAVIVENVTAAVVTASPMIVENDAKTARIVAAMTDNTHRRARIAKKEVRTTKTFAAPSRVSISKTRRPRSSSMPRSKIRLSRDPTASRLHATMASPSIGPTTPPRIPNR